MIIAEEDAKAALMNNDSPNSQYSSPFDMPPPAYEAATSNVMTAASQTTPLLEAHTKSKHEQEQSARATLRFFRAFLLASVAIHPKLTCVDVQNIL
jgi:hypothetical protein